MSIRAIIAGGGTGGHIFPALSIANELKKQDPLTEILFVGANGGMEMTLVPQNNFNILGVTISGLKRPLWHPRSLIKNIAFPFRLISSLQESKSIIQKFKPDVVIGVGGYASGPLGKAALKMKIPLVLCEQNAYPGMTNKWLAPGASIILLGNEAAQKYFTGYNVKVTGNPVRASLLSGNAEAGRSAYGFTSEKPIVLSLGGSLGAGTLNTAIENGLDAFRNAGVQVLWQCGKRYYPELKERVKAEKGIVLLPFIDNMADAFSMADLVISRAGGSTISELILLSKPSIMVPSPNVAEDHQTKNALSLVDRKAALLIKDVDAGKKLVPETLSLLSDKSRLQTITNAIQSMEKHDAAHEIVTEILKVVSNRNK